MPRDMSVHVTDVAVPPASPVKRSREDSATAEPAGKRLFSSRDVSPTTLGSEQLQEGHESSWGCQTTIGGRSYMEDAHFVGQLDNQTGCSERKASAQMFGVFDGHGGPTVAKFLAANVQSFVSRSMSRHQSELEALKDAFVSMDASLPADAGMDLGGSTANVVILSEDKIICANCGDSRSVLSRQGRAIALSDDHKPDRDDEEARINAAGGRVMYNSGARVMGVLSMSRAIGDTWLRKYGVIPDPEVKVLLRSSDDEFMIVASDGLWGNVSDEEAVSFTRRCLDRAASKGIGRTAAARIAAKVLIRAAMHRGSRDNITVIVVILQPDSAVPGGTQVEGQWSAEDMAAATPIQPVTPPLSPTAGPLRSAATVSEAHPSSPSTGVLQQRLLIQGLLQGPEAGPKPAVSMQAQVQTGPANMAPMSKPMSMREVCTQIRVHSPIKTEQLKVARGTLTSTLQQLQGQRQLQQQQQQMGGLQPRVGPGSAPGTLHQMQLVHALSGPLVDILQAHQRLRQEATARQRLMHLPVQQPASIPYEQLPQQLLCSTSRLQGSQANLLRVSECSGSGRLLSAERLVVSVKANMIQATVV